MELRPTPDDAALAGFGEHATVVLTAAEGDHAAVLMLTDGRGGYHYMVLTVRTDGGWAEAVSGNANDQWLLTDEDTGRGFRAWWSEVPPDVDAVRVRWKGGEREAPAQLGYCLWARSDVDANDAEEFVELAAVRRGQKWRRVRRDRAGRWMHQQLNRLERETLEGRGGDG